MNVASDGPANRAKKSGCRVLSSQSHMQSLSFVTLKPVDWMLIGCLVVIVALSAFPFSLINEAESDRALVYRSSKRFIEKLYSNVTIVFYSDLCDKHKIVHNCEVEVKLCFFSFCFEM